MKKYLLEYKTKIEQFIMSKLNTASVEEIDEVLKDFETMIQYFQHERLIHLIVTVTFALLEIISIIAVAFSESIVPLVLAILFLVLLVPYVFHYYFLENNVQEFYKMRDKIVAARKKKN